ncbi:cysteine and histidine-rich domain-containing protein 1-like [Tubulanus polymorphus]|uniref:cysteine and histidine-rich domain-containing protein 1-like n=1 Tax=Tubulanus polymorphus TaxID=672921 RepID=UPI003DA1FE0A
MESQCYNKGCGKKFDPKVNDANECVHHPGEPYFHDGYKEWTCCKKKSRDFTEFLNSPGCTTGCHSNEKPPEPEKPVEEDVLLKQEVITVEAPKPPVRLERPSNDDVMIPLKQNITSSLTTALEKFANLSVDNSMNNIDDPNTVTAGTPCANKGCGKAFVDESSNDEQCHHHPGYPVFHEGLKFWSCCKVKTSDFAKFLEQSGCETGKHIWKKKGDKKKLQQCRVDWHQTGSYVTISIFAKATSPENALFEANGVSVKVHLEYEGCQYEFDRLFNLCGIIDPKSSAVKLLGTKVEINLKKAEPFSWTALEQS